MTFLLISRFVTLETNVGLPAEPIVLFENNRLEYLLTVDSCTPTSLAISYVDVDPVNACLRSFTFSSGSRLGMRLVIR